MSDASIAPPLPPAALESIRSLQQAFNCPCWKLTGILGPDCKLKLDHVCDETKLHTVMSWHTDHFDRWTVPTMEWPLPYKGRWLMLVIRQWALEEIDDEGKSGERFAQHLAQLEGWRLCEQVMAAAYRYRMAYASPDATDDEVAELRGPLRQACRNARMDVELEDIVYDMRNALKLLRLHNLPASPAIVSYLRAKAAGSPNPPLPRRGLLVTTLVYGRPSGKDEQEAPLGFRDGDADVTIEGPLTSTVPLMERAVAIAQQHRDWLYGDDKEKKGLYPTLLLNSSVRSQARALVQHGARSLDFREEALRLPNLMLMKQQIEADRAKNGRRANPVRVVRKQLDVIGRNTRKRRRTHGIDPAGPPNGWKDELVPAILSLIPSL